MPKLSIVVPVYNSEKYLKRCLDSIHKQSFTDYECILVNDGSQDNSTNICEAYVKIDNRFKLVNQVNQGASAARNEGIKQASGEYISFIDSDDWIELDTYESLIKKEYSKYDLICFGINKNGKKVPFKESTIEKQFIKFQVYMNSPCNKLYKRNVIITNQIFFPEYLHTSEDFIFNIIYFGYCNEIIYEPLSFYNYSFNPNSLTNKSNNKKNADCLIEIANLLPSIIDKKYDLLINYRKFISKFYLYNYDKDYLRFYKTYKESNKYILFYNLPLKSIVKIIAIFMYSKILTLGNSN